MSDRLTISAVFSVLMMTLFVLAGAETPGVDTRTDLFESSHSVGAAPFARLPDGWR